MRSLVEAELGGVAVTDRWNDLTAVVGQRCGADMAQFFAEPSISRSNGASEAVARWYSESEGPAVSFAALDSASRTAAATQLASYLSRLEPLLRDPATSDLVGAGLHIPSMSDVMMVGGRPVLVNWGFLPEDVAAIPARRETHFRTTLGQFLPGVAVPAFAAAGGTGARAAVATGPALAAAASSAAPTAALAETAVIARRDRPWLPVAIATAVALICLVVLLIPGVLVYPDQGAPTAAEVATRREANRSLEEQIEKLRKQLAEAVCTPQNPAGLPSEPKPAAPPAGKVPAESSPPKREGALPGPGAPVEVAADNTRPLGNRQLVALLEQATVMVIVVATDGNGVESFGSGFFINPTQVVTNRHVVQSQKHIEIFITNKTLGRPLPIKLAAVTTGTQIGRDDFALLQLDQATGIAGLPLGLKAERLDAVTAAGYPGTLLKSDPAFLRLIRGDGSAMPEMSTTQGIVTAIQANAGATLIFHSAMILGGNSGGPLVDSCGRAVAVNTFTRKDEERPATLNGALSAVNLQRFLEAGGVSFGRSESRCEGASAVATVTAPPPSPAPGPAK